MLPNSEDSKNYIIDIKILDSKVHGVYTVNVQFRIAVSSEAAAGQL